EAKDADLPQPRPPGKSRAVLLPPVPPHWDTVPGGLSLGEIGSASPLRTLHRQAVERFAATPAYSARLRRRERWEERNRPEELILFKYRKEPFSLYLRWLGSEAKGREVLYVQGRDDDQLTIGPGPADTHLVPSQGRRTVLRHDGPRGLGHDRYPIAETGVHA